MDIGGVAGDQGEVMHHRGGGDQGVDDRASAISRKNTPEPGHGRVHGQDSFGKRQLKIVDSETDSHRCNWIAPSLHFDAFAELPYGQRANE